MISPLIMVGYKSTFSLYKPQNPPRPTGILPLVGWFQNPTSGPWISPKDSAGNETAARSAVSGSLIRNGSGDGRWRFWGHNFGASKNGGDRDTHQPSVRFSHHFDDSHHFMSWIKNVAIKWNLYTENKGKPEDIYIGVHYFQTNLFSLMIFRTTILLGHFPASHVWLPEAVHLFQILSCWISSMMQMSAWIFYNLEWPLTMIYNGELCSQLHLEHIRLLPYHFAGVPPAKHSVLHVHNFSHCATKCTLFRGRKV